MKLRPLYAVLALACGLAATLHSQDASPAPAPTTAPRKPPQPLAVQAPGAAPDKVWYNAASKVYHCPGDRYYGRTKDGKYMSEAEAKAAGAHGPRGTTCFK
jgi:hypothetical protein